MLIEDIYKKRLTGMTVDELHEELHEAYNAKSISGNLAAGLLVAELKKRDIKPCIDPKLIEVVANAIRDTPLIAEGAIIAVFEELGLKEEYRYVPDILGDFPDGLRNVRLVSDWRSIKP